MANSEKILVSGATGNLGRAVIDALTTRGFTVKAGSRNPSEGETLPGVEPVKLDFEAPDTFDKALDDVSGVFLIAPPMDPEAPAKLAPFIDTANAKGVNHIVFCSAMGVDYNEEAPLRIIERYLMGSGVNNTILRPNFFMENFSSGFIAPMIAKGGIFLAAGDGKTSFISTVDIAEVAALAFAHQHFGKEYNLTGPEALDHTQVAKLISDTTGKEVTYHALEEEEMLQGARDAGLPEGAVQYLAILYGAVREGLTASVTAGVEEAAGHAPVSFAEFVSNNASAWS